MALFTVYFSAIVPIFELFELFCAILRYFALFSPFLGCGKWLVFPMEAAFDAAVSHVEHVGTDIVDVALEDQMRRHGIGGWFAKDLAMVVEISTGNLSRLQPSLLSIGKLTKGWLVDHLSSRRTHRRTEVLQ